MSKVLDWLDSRSGYREAVYEALYERIPGGSRWRYVWGSTLVLAFFTQVITGIFLWMGYSASAQTAWESVYYLQFQTAGGELLRGIHHHMATAMVILLALHFLQVVWDGAYRAPRELNYILGLVLMMLTLGLALTGYLLPWDQKGFWATKVATNIAGLVPGIGPSLQTLIVGGKEYGHYTLTRFFALHAGVLPGLLVLFLGLHLALFRRHGITARSDGKRADQYFWPDQILKDGIASCIVLGFVIFLAWWEPAELGAPADPASPYDAARPEWYFLFLFQFLKYFHGEIGEQIGAIYVPGGIMAVLFLMPWIGRNRMGHWFNVSFVILLLAGSGVLTFLAWWEDYNDPAYQKAVAAAEHDAERARELAEGKGIPPQGALSLMREDPKSQGAKLFKQHCAGCHTHEDRTGQETSMTVANEEPTAPNLYGFGSREWVGAILDPEQVADKHHFGYPGSPFDDEEYLDSGMSMVAWVKENIGDAAEEDRSVLKLEVEKVVKALSAEAGLGYQAALGVQDQDEIEQGRMMILDQTDFITCTDCHKFHAEGYLGSAPDLTGYASREWLIDFIRNPAHERFYGDPEERDPGNDRMPIFAYPPDDPSKHLLPPETIGLIVDWLRRDWYRPEDTKESESE